MIATDAIVRLGWRCSVLAMILVAALLGLGLSYHAMRALIAVTRSGNTGRLTDVITMIGVSVVAGLSVKWLCEHRNELVEC